MYGTTATFQLVVLFSGDLSVELKNMQLWIYLLVCLLILVSRAVGREEIAGTRERGAEDVLT